MPDPRPDRALTQTQTQTQTRPRPDPDQAQTRPGPDLALAHQRPVQPSPPPAPDPPCIATESDLLTGPVQDPEPARPPPTVDHPAPPPWFDNGEGGKLKWRAFERHGSPPAVVDIARHGYDWLVSQDPDPADMANYASAVDRPEVAAEEFDWLSSHGIVEWFDEWAPTVPPGGDTSQGAFASVINGIAIVPKPHTTDKWRPIVDFKRSGANRYMLPLPFKLPMPKSFLPYVNPSFVTLRKDLANGFFHLRLRPRARTYCGFRHPLTGRLGRYTSPPFGAAQSPYAFCLITSEAARIMRAAIATAAADPATPPALARDLAKIFLDVYVDDFIIIGPPAAVQEADAIVTRVATELGLEFKPSKDVLGATIEVLGVTLCNLTMSISLPQEKAERYRRDLHTFRDRYSGAPSVPRQDLEQLAGRLQFAAQCCRWGRAFTRHLLRALWPPSAREGAPPEHCVLSPTAWDREIPFWDAVLATPTSHWNTRSQYSTSPWAFAIQLPHIM